MPEVAPDIVVDELGPEVCANLLETHHFGRLAVVVDGGPVIFPVNYAFHDGRVAIRTDPGTKLAAAALGRVAFEVDGVDETAHTGWSVLVRGTGFDVTDSIDEQSEELRRAGVDTWAPGSKANWVRIEPTAITGRRIRPA